MNLAPNNDKLVGTRDLPILPDSATRDRKQGESLLANWHRFGLVFHRRARCLDRTVLAGILTTAKLLFRPRDRCCLPSARAGLADRNVRESPFDDEQSA